MRRVAVVIPAWDDYVEWDLPRAVASVINQGVPARVIVVDNASNTPIPRLAGAEIAETPTRMSRGEARNFGLAFVDEPLVVFLDADDEMLPGSLAALQDGIDAAPEAVAHVLPIVDVLTGRRFRAPRRVARLASSSPRMFATLNAIWSIMPVQGATIMRTNVVRAAGGYGDRDGGEDWMLGARLATRGRITFGSTPALLYRRRATDAAKTTAEMFDRARRVRAHLREDPERGLAAQALSPAIAVAQAAVLAARPAVLAWRHASGVPQRDAVGLGAGFVKSE